MTKKRLGSLLIACVMTVTMALGLCQVGAAETATGIPGGWTLTEMATCQLPEKVAAFFEGGLGGLVGATYQPVLYLASQVVAGTNHMILCVETRMTAQMDTFFAAVVVYEDLEGNVSLTSIQEIDLANFVEAVG